MNGNAAAQMRQARSLNEVLAILNKYYDLDEPFGEVTGIYIKGQLVTQLDTMIEKLKVKERGQQPQSNNKKWF